MHKKYYEKVNKLRLCDLWKTKIYFKKSFSIQTDLLVFIEITQKSLNIKSIHP